MKWKNTHLDGVKNEEKKKQFIMKHVMYTHISNNEFITFSFYPQQEKKKKKSVEVKKYAYFQE